MPRILPDRQRTKPVPVRILIHDDFRKTRFGEKVSQLGSMEDPHSINDGKPLVIPGILSIRLIDDQKDAARPKGSVHLPETLCRAGPEIYGFKRGRKVKSTIPKGKMRHISLYDMAAPGLQPLAVHTPGRFHGYFRIVQRSNRRSRIFP